MEYYYTWVFVMYLPAYTKGPLYIDIAYVIFYHLNLSVVKSSFDWLLMVSWAASCLYKESVSPPKYMSKASCGSKLATQAYGMSNIAQE